MPPLGPNAGSVTSKASSPHQVGRSSSPGREASPLSLSLPVAGRPAVTDVEFHGQAGAAGPPASKQERGEFEAVEGGCRGQRGAWRIEERRGGPTSVPGLLWQVQPGPWSANSVGREQDKGNLPVPKMHQGKAPEGVGPAHSTQPHVQSSSRKSCSARTRPVGRLGH